MLLGAAQLARILNFGPFTYTQQLCHACSAVPGGIQTPLSTYCASSSQFAHPSTISDTTTLLTTQKPKELFYWLLQWN
jgi:hypothetical protein